MNIRWIASLKEIFGFEALSGSRRQVQAGSGCTDHSSIKSDGVGQSPVCGAGDAFPNPVSAFPKYRSCVKKIQRIKSAEGGSAPYRAPGNKVAVG